MGVVQSTRQEVSNIPPSRDHHHPPKQQQSRNKPQTSYTTSSDMTDTPHQQQQQPASTMPQVNIHCIYIYHLSIHLREQIECLYYVVVDRH